MKLDNKVYNTLKWITQIVLPAIGTLYFGLSSIWGLPYSEQVVGTITCLTAFLGITLGISTNSYKKDGMDGILKIDTSKPEVDSYSFEVNIPIDEIPERKEIYMKVNKQ